MPPALLRDAAVEYALSEGKISKSQAVNLRVVASFALDHAALQAYLQPSKPKQADPASAAPSPAGGETNILGVDLADVGFIRARIQCDAELLACSQDDAVYKTTSRVFDWNWSIKAAVEREARATVGVEFEGASAREGPYARLATVPALAIPITVDDPVGYGIGRATGWLDGLGKGLTSLQKVLTLLGAIGALVGGWFVVKKKEPPAGGK